MFPKSVQISSADTSLMDFYYILLGAPGFESGSIQYDCDKSIEDDLSYIMSILENCLDKILDQKYGCSLISPFGIGNILQTKLIFKYPKPIDCKSDSRLSRSFLRIPNRMRSTSTGDRNVSRQTVNSAVNLGSCGTYDYKKTDTNWLKLSSNEYHSE